MKKIIKIISFLSLCVIGASGYCQQLQALDSVSISFPQKASIDRLNNIYLVDDRGGIDKYDSDIKLVLQYSPQQLAEISLIEAWNPLKVFIFYQDFQEYIFLDRFLTATSRFNVREFSNYTRAATISADNNVWLLDYADFSLKKYDVILNQITIATSLSQVLSQDDNDIRYLREYQNLLFLADFHHGIFVFDNLGNYLRKIETDSVEYFNFKGNNLYYLKDNSIELVDIYTLTEKKIELKNTPLFAFFYDNKLLTLTESKIIKYKILDEN